MMANSTENKYAIGKEFMRGLVAGLVPTSHRSQSESDHWLSGWDAGYQMRGEKTRHLNEYLTSIGQEPMAMITTASK